MMLYSSPDTKIPLISSTTTRPPAEEKLPVSIHSPATEESLHPTGVAARTRKHLCASPVQFTLEQVRKQI